MFRAAILWAALLLPGLVLPAEVGSYPTSGALGGSERMLSDQGGVTVDITPVLLGNFFFPSGLLPCASVPPLTGDVISSNCATTISVAAVTDTKAALANKPSAYLFSASNIASLSGLPTIDGTTMTRPGVALLGGQSTQSQNGFWCVPASGPWARCPWYASGNLVQATVDETAYVRAGTTYGGASCWLSAPTTGTITIDTTNTSWTCKTGAGSVIFSSIGSGTNTTAAMVVGSGASLAPTGSGTITATNTTGINGAAVPLSGTVVGSNGSGQLVSPTTTGTGSVTLATAPTISSPCVLGSSTGCTAIASANSSATNYTATLPIGSFTFGQTANVQTFNSSGTWTKPTAGTPQTVFIFICGAGGGGGGGAKTTSGTTASGGASGGGGVCWQEMVPASSLTSTVTVTVGAVGTAGAASTTNSTGGSAGGVGGTTTFGAYLSAYGGGGGQGGAINAASGGGGGAGSYGAGTSGAAGTGGAAGNANGGAGGSGGTGTGSNTGGGAGGGGAPNGGAATGNGGYGTGLGGGGGGAGGGVAVTPGTVTGGCGGGAGPVPFNCSGSPSLNGFLMPGPGGYGGNSSATTATAGAAGLLADGGGGGGSTQNSGTAGAGGLGGPGIAIVITIF